MVSTDVIVGVIGAIALLLGALISAPRLVRDPLTVIQRQLDIYKSLPPESSSRAAILSRVEQQIGQLDTEDEARRNPAGIALAVMFFIAACAAGWLAFGAGAWGWLLWPVAAVLLLFGAVGFGQSVVKVPRHANGQSLAYREAQQKKRDGVRAQKH